MSTALTLYKTRYVAKKAFFSFMGASFRLFGEDGSLAFFVKQKAFKLKEQITVFADEDRTDAMLGIQARAIMDISATYDVTDLKSGKTVGALKRAGLKSIFKDEWSLLDSDGNAFGKIEEASMFAAMLSRLIRLLPQTYQITVNEEVVGQIKQRFNPFILSYDVDFGTGGGALDPRMGVAAVVMLLAIEGRQD
jgi:uncharacterized protein YxjI